MFHSVILFFIMMDYAPQASLVPATLFVTAANTKERMASGNGRAVKCKSVCDCHPAFVLREQMDVWGEPMANFSHLQKEQVKSNTHSSFFFLPPGP